MNYVLADDAAQKHPFAQVTLKGTRLVAICTKDDKECLNEAAKEQEIPVSIKDGEGQAHKILRPFSGSCESCLRNPSRKE